MDKHDGSLNSYVSNVREIIDARFDQRSPEKRLFKEEHFVQIAIDLLKEIGEIDDATLSFYSKRDLKVNAYYINDQARVLDLYGCAGYSGDLPPRGVDEEVIDLLFKSVKNFFEESCGDLFLKIDETSEAFLLSKRINQEARLIQSVRFFLVFDGVCESRKQHAEIRDHVRYLTKIVDWSTLASLSLRPPKLPDSFWWTTIIPFRDGQKVRFRVPNDLTEAEAYKLAEIVRKIPQI